MADTKLADLTALTTTSDDDILYVVDDPAGTPADRKLALGDVFKRGTVTTSSPVIDAAQTWNDGAVTFTGLRFNAATGSSAGSAAASLLMDLQLEGSSKLKITKVGNAVSSGGLSADAPAYGLGATGLWSRNNTLRLNFAINGSDASVELGPQLLAFGSTSFIAWTSGTLAGSGQDLFLTRRAAANLRLGASDTSASATITVTIAAPGVVTWSNHSLSTGSPVIFTTTGALPTGITADTTYYAIPVTGNTFQLASSFANALAGTAITTSGTQSGTHTGRRGAIAQQFGPQDTLSTGSLENINGADFVIRGSRSIGNKPGGSIIFQVAPAGSSGTAQNALADALTINGDQTVQFASTIALGGSSSAKLARYPGTTFIESDSNGGFSVAPGTSSGISMRQGFFNAGPASYYGWNSFNGFQTPDLRLYRDAANTLALRNGANAQAFRVYNTYTSATDFERGNIFWDSNVLKIGTEKGSTGGTARALEFQTDGTTRITIAANGVVTLPSFNAGSMTSSGFCAVGGAQFYAFTSRSRIYSPSDGVLGIYNDAATDFNRLQFGGTTSSFPALKRSSTTLIVRLADDTANAALESASLKTDAPTGGTAATWKLGTVASVSPTSPNRTIEVDIGGTIYYLHAKTTND